MIQLNLFLSENSKLKGKPIYHLAIEESRKLGIQGASVFRTTENYGQNGKVHQERLLELGSHHSMMLVIVSEEAKINQLIKSLQALQIKGFYTTHSVEAKNL